MSAFGWTEARLRIERGPEGALRGISGEVVLRSDQVVSFLGERDVSEREGRISGTVRFYSSRRLDRTGSRFTVAPATDGSAAALLHPRHRHGRSLGGSALPGRVPAAP